jgi:hypothetical protein
VDEEPTYHRIETSSQTAAVAALQITSQEMWGGPTGNYLNSDIPKVKAFSNELPLQRGTNKKQRGIEFTTAVPPDPYHPAFVFWSGEREGVRNEDGYAKISVSITFCNQLEQG